MSKLDGEPVDLEQWKTEAAAEVDWQIGFADDDKSQPQYDYAQRILLLIELLQQETQMHVLTSYQLKKLLEHYKGLRETLERMDSKDIEEEQRLIRQGDCKHILEAYKYEIRTVLERFPK